MRTIPLSWMWQSLARGCPLGGRGQSPCLCHWAGSLQPHLGSLTLLLGKGRVARVRQGGDAAPARVVCNGHGIGVQRPGPSEARAGAGAGAGRAVGRVCAPTPFACQSLAPRSPIALPLQDPGAGAAGVFPYAPQSSGLCACAVPRGPGQRRLRASPSLARAGTVSLGQATALASDREVSAHLGHSSVMSPIKATEANYCHMLAMI